MIYKYLAQEIAGQSPFRWHQQTNQTNR